MPNINVTVEETTYRNARVWAAMNNTNISQMVRRFLDTVAEGEVADLAQARLAPSGPKPAKELSATIFLFLYLPLSRWI